jgi:hypothetical protein
MCRRRSSGARGSWRNPGHPRHPLYALKSAAGYNPIGDDVGGVVEVEIIGEDVVGNNVGIYYVWFTLSRRSDGVH